MNELDNFCIADSLAQDNGWSLGQQWGFASFMNDCDKASESQKQRESLKERKQKTDELIAAFGLKW